MSQLRIKVGASRDRSLDTAFQPAIAAAQKAANAIAGIGAKQARTYASDTKRGTDAAEKEFAKLAKQADRWQKQMVRDAERSIADKLRAEERAAAAATRLAERTARDQQRIADRTAANETRLANRTTAATARNTSREQVAQSRSRSRLASTGLQAAGRIGGAAGRAAIGFARDYAAGAGVDMSLSSIFGKNNSLEATAQNLSNSGYMAGDKRNGNRVSTRELMEQGVQVGRNTGTDANEALQGLSKYTSKTGDLATGREILGDMAVLSKATGASLEDMVDAAGDAANALGDVDNKGQKVSRLMRVMAGEGKLGAVEIKDLATSMAALGAAANTFGGGEEAVAQMGVLAQAARRTGGAKSASQAATSVSSFANTFSKGARLHAFKAFGVETQTSENTPRDAKSIIVDAIRAASSTQFGGMKNFSENMGKMFMDTRARTATKDFEFTYAKAGGGEAGIKAVIASFEELRNAALKDVEIQESFRRAMATTEAQANVLNNAFRDSALKIQDAATKFAIKLAPKLTKAADFAAWAVGGEDEQENQAEKANRDAIGATGEAVKSQGTKNVIDPETQKQLQQNASQALEHFNRRKAEAGKAHSDYDSTGSSVGRVLRGANDYTPAGALGNLAAGFFGGKPVGAADNEERDANLRTTDQRVQETKAASEQASAMEKAVKSAIDSGTLKVHIVKDDTKSKDSAPGVDTAGTGNVLDPDG